MKRYIEILFPEAARGQLLLHQLRNSLTGVPFPCSQEPASQELHQGAGTHLGELLRGLKQAQAPSLGCSASHKDPQQSVGADTNLSSQALTHSDSRCWTCCSASPGPWGQDSRLFVCSSGRCGKPAALPPPYRPNPSGELTHSSWATVSSLSPPISDAACPQGCRWKAALAHG